MRNFGKSLWCTLCGAEVRTGWVRRDRVRIRFLGGSPNRRTLVLNGDTIHACPIGQPGRLRTGARRVGVRVSEPRSDGAGT